jgi:hypothetical protein
LTTRILLAALLLLLPLSAAAQTGSTFTDRLYGLNTASAIKAPVQCATTGAITLSGAQTIDGVAVTDHLSDSTDLPPDRVLVKNQADQTTNGIYSVSATGAWQLAGDWQGAYNAVSGTLVLVNGGSTQQGIWQLTTANPVVIAPTVGSGSNITFTEYSPTVGTATNALNLSTSTTSTNASYYIMGAATVGGGFQNAGINSGVSFNPSTGILSATGFTGTSANLTGTATIQNLTVNGTCTGCSGSASLTINGLIAATGANSINNSSFAQTWSWQSLTTNTALTLSTTNATTGTLLAISEITTGSGAALTSTLTGLGNSGYAGYFTNTATTGYAIYSAGAEEVTGVLTVTGNASLTGTTSVSNLNTGNANLGGTTTAANITASNITVTGTCTGCGAGALILLSTVNASGAAQVVFSSTYLTATYNKYVVEYDSVKTSDSSGSAYLELEISTDGSTFNAPGCLGVVNAAGSVVSDANPGNIGFLSNAGTDTVAEGRVYLTLGRTNEGFAMDAKWSGPQSSSTAQKSGSNGCGYHLSSGTVTTVKLFDSSGTDTISGNFHLYGLLGS